MSEQEPLSTDTPEDNVRVLMDLLTIYLNKAVAKLTEEGY